MIRLSLRVKTFFSWIFAAALLGLCFGAIRFPGAIGQGVGMGISVCLETLIPSLFFFMVTASLLASSQAAQFLSWILSPITHFFLRLPRQLGFPLLISAIGGYPVGAAMLCQLYSQDKISTRQASRMVCFCCNPSPAFLIGGVGLGMLGNAKAGWVLYIGSLLSSLLIGFFLGLGEKGQASSSLSKGPLLPSLPRSMKSSVSSMVVMCGYVLFFSGLSALLEISGALEALGTWLHLNDGQISTLSCLFSGLLEVTSGAWACSNASPFCQTVLLPFFVSFSGLSVICQVAALMDAGPQRAPIPLSPFLVSRLAHGVLTAIICRPFLAQLELSSPVFSSAAGPLVPSADANTPLLILTMAWMSAMVFLAFSRLLLKRKSLSV